ncbi:MAG: creatininase family protein [Candidatus Methanomethylicia archaeon]
MLSFENTNAEIEKVDPKMAILPIGSLEQHSKHLPISTDTIIAFEVAKKIAENFNALLLPPFNYSISMEHQNFKSTVWLSPLTLYYTIKDIATSLKKHDFKVFVIVNGHGANFLLRNVVREINYQMGLLTILIDLANMYFGSREAKEIHAGNIETSLILYLKPNLVKREFLEDEVPEVSRDYLDYAPLDEISKSGIWGEAKKASSENGKKIFENIVTSAINDIKKVLKFKKFTHYFNI